jgi:Arc/MetJ-type ribon-helix-helix transcriptional regulator
LEPTKTHVSNPLDRRRSPQVALRLSELCDWAYRKASSAAQLSKNVDHSSPLDLPIIAARAGLNLPLSTLEFLSDAIYLPSKWMAGGWRMAGSVHELRAKTPDSEKVTINLGYVDLGRIDLLVNDGFYSNRTDFIRTAIRNHLDQHQNAVAQSIARQRLELGLRHYGRNELEAVQSAGETLAIQVLGLVVIANDVTPDLARATIASIRVLGALQASPEVKVALRDRIH